MAGIGFVLRKLYRRDDLSGLARAFMHSAFASTGPWLFTVFALGIIAIIGNKMVSRDVLFTFRTVLIYNFSFSLMLSGPILMIVTRYLSDSIYRRDVSNATGTLFGALILMWGIEAVIAGLFYGVFVKLGPAMAISAFVDFLLLSAIWLMAIFLSALRNYWLITIAFLFGMLIAIFACLFLGTRFGAVGMLNGFSLGLAIITGILLGNILVEYPYPIKEPFAFLSYFKKFPDLALSGLVYNMAIWVDKWMMWFAPEAIKMNNGLVVYPNYDSTMFMAYLSTVPAMALFLFHAETHFFEQYARFYRHIEQKVSLAKIEKDHRNIVRSIFGSSGNFFLMQSIIALLGVLVAPQIIFYLHGNYLQIGMLRYGMLGSLFQVLTLFMLVLFSYFDNRKANLTIQSIFLVTNAAFTWISIDAGFRFYGFGYFLASFLTFVIAAVFMRYYVKQLPYHTFVTTNASVT